MRLHSHRFLAECINGNEPLVSDDEFDEIGAPTKTECTPTNGMQSLDVVTKNWKHFTNRNEVALFINYLPCGSLLHCYSIVFVKISPGFKDKSVSFASV